VSAAVQKLLTIRAELRLPTVDLAGARAILGETVEEIVDQVDTLQIPAWDISVSPSGAERRELRLSAVACRNLAEGKPVNLDLDDITRRIYGLERPFLKGTWFARSWNCERKTVLRLCESGVLDCIPLADGSKWSPGRNGTPAITWKSALAFLKSRRIK
jgi:hypothetical protein